MEKKMNFNTLNFILCTLIIFMSMLPFWYMYFTRPIYLSKSVKNLTDSIAFLFTIINMSPIIFYLIFKRIDYKKSKRL